MKNLGIATEHIEMRMQQRGIPKSLLSAVLKYGERNHDGKTILNRRQAKSLVEALSRELKVLKQIERKGGICLVEENQTLITCYNLRRR